MAATCSTNPFTFTHSSVTVHPGPRKADSGPATACILPVSQRPGLSSLIQRFPPNFARQLSFRPGRSSCSVAVGARIVASSWSRDDRSKDPPAEVGRLLKTAEVTCSVSPVKFAKGDDPTVAAEEVISANAADSAPVDDTTSEKSAATSIGATGTTADVQVNLATGNDRAVAARFSDGTLAVHAGHRWDRPIITNSLTTPLVETAPYFFSNTAALKDLKAFIKSFGYGRYGNPTTSAAEEKISALEGAQSTLLTASGSYTIVVMLLALVPSGAHILTTTDCYRNTRIFIEDFLPKLGITVTVIDPADVKALESALDNDKCYLFFTESPSSLFLRCVDIELVSKICHRKGALVCIDGTLATPMNQKALALGADLVLHSVTKYISGHNDVHGGCISGPRRLVSKVRKLHHMLGGTISPVAAEKIIKSIKTLHLRVDQHNYTGLRMAQIIESHSKVERVYYPGLPSHPEHELAKRQMTGYGGVVSFEVREADKKLLKFLDLNATKFVDALKIPKIAAPLGSFDSILNQPALMCYWDVREAERLKYGIKDSLVRFSFGLEDFDELKADVLQALDAI